MTTAKNKSKAMQDLLMQSALLKEKEIQSTNNVVEKQDLQFEKSIQKNISIEQQEHSDSRTENRNKEEKDNISKEKKFVAYLEDRKIKNSETIRISSEVHRKLKQIALATDVSMYVIATNILEDICSTYNKEIQNILKKYMSM